MSAGWLFVLDVMDKEPTITTLWVLAILIGIAGTAASMYRWWLGVAASLAGLVFAAAVLREIYDPFVGPAISQEAGRSYIVQAQVVSALAVLVPLAATLAGRRHSRRSQR